ncbi:uncharacterized protein LOC111058745 isoform X2 [Nilaparvata lugens]|uniref:uncharacterized protein LOC111058745 isoform X2 n=1 Tax=Nilaparvata lugens TaxID=108931 RepID=UPI00193D1E79|nr:uncharacterized protein LOC111058745 isoform X2 [Nilaparvata lugens]
MEQQNRRAIFYTTDKLTCLEFYKKIDSGHKENILSVREAFNSKKEKDFIIVGKVVMLPPKIGNEKREDIIKKVVPGTFLVIREVVVASDGTSNYGYLYKVKFLGSIAEQILESDVVVGDRIALKNITGIEKNTEYCQDARLSPLTPFALDISKTTVIIGKKVAVEQRCDTPDRQDENLLQDDARAEVEEHDSPTPQPSGLSSNKKRTFIDSPPSSPASPVHSTKTPQKTKKLKTKSPTKPLLHLALEEDENSPTDATSNPAKVYQKNKFINLKDINETMINKKVNIFGIIIDVLQTQENGNKKKWMRLKIIDQSIPLHKAFEIFVFYDDEKPKICKRWIARLKNVKIESFKGETNGRIFSPSCLICFPIEKGMPKFITTRKKQYDIPDEDRQAVKSLKSFLANHKSWNILTLPNSYYANKPNASYSPHLKLEDITENISFFSLKCKVVSFRIFLEVEMAFLTVEDSTVCHPRTYKFPRNATSWPAVIQNDEVYCPESSTIDILLTHSCDSNVVNLLMQAGVHVDIIEIETRKMISENKHGLMFIANMQKSNISQIAQVDPTPLSESQDEVEEDDGEEDEEEETQTCSDAVGLSEYNGLMAECRVEPVTPTTDKLLAPVSQKKKKKRRKLVPISGSAKISQKDIPTENANVLENDGNSPVQDVAGHELVKTSNQNSDMRETENSKSRYVSRPKSTPQKVSSDESSSSKKSMKLPVLLVHKLTDDELIQLSPKACTPKTNKMDGHQPQDHERISTLIAIKKTIDAVSIPVERSGRTSKPGASSSVVSKTGSVDLFDDASASTSKPKETRQSEKEDLPSSKDINTGKPLSPCIAKATSIDEMNHTVHEIMSVEECSLIENNESSENVLNTEKSVSPKKNKKILSDRDTVANCVKPITRSAARNMFHAESPRTRSSMKNYTNRNGILNKYANQPSPSSSSSSPKKKKLPDRTQQNSNTNKTSECDKAPTSSSSYENLSDQNHYSANVELDTDRTLLENDEKDQNTLHPEKSPGCVKNVCRERSENSPDSTTRQRTDNEVDVKSRGSSSLTQFSPTEQWLRERNSEIILEPEEAVADPLDGSQNPLNLKQTQNSGEYMNTGLDVDALHQGVDVISDNAVIINSEPSIFGKPLDIISGLCEKRCDTFYRYSVVSFNSNSKPICPKCYNQGKIVELDLRFLFKLNLILHRNPNICYAAVVHFNQATRFLGCSVEEYMNDEGVRSRVVHKLSSHFLLKEKPDCGLFCSPSLPVTLRISKHSEKALVILVDTILPEPVAVTFTQPFSPNNSSL